MPLMFKESAPAKINLLLDILGKRPDGFHEVRFIMQSVALHDDLAMAVDAPGLDIHFSCSDPALSTPDNLVARAYYLFYETTGLPSYRVKVRLEKRIPVQAGLGGGSSDAAAMLRLLNRLHENCLTRDELMKMGAALGSDVPFFFYGGTCLATGRGETITPLSSLPGLPVLLLKPRRFGISTPEAYGRITPAHLQLPALPDDFWQNPPRDPRWLGKHLFNRFESVLFPHYPGLQSAKTTLADLPGIYGALLSGSGPTLFALYEPSADLEPVLPKLFPEQDWQCFPTTFSPPLG